MSGKNVAVLAVVEDSPVVSQQGEREEFSEQPVPECVAEPCVTEPSVGEQLRRAREARGMSAAEIAKLLKLSTHQVEALESDDWTRLPWNTIIRGFVRNYARLLNLNPAELMAHLDRQLSPPTHGLEMPMGTNVRIPQEGKAERRDYIRIFSGLLLLFLAVLAYFFFPQDLWKAAMSGLKGDSSGQRAVLEKPESVLPEARAPATAIVAPAATVLSNETPAMTRAVSVAAHAVKESDSRASTEPQAAPGNVAGNLLKFSFAQPSWVEVRDRTGEIIFSELSQAGSSREVEGRPPLSLVVGNASYVSVQYKGKPVDLSKRSKDDVARLTVE